MTVDGELVPRGVMQVNWKEYLLKSDMLQTRSIGKNLKFQIYTDSFTGFCTPSHGESHLIDIYLKQLC